jgi:hypothetical protein
VPDKVNLNALRSRLYSEPKTAVVSQVDLGKWVSITAIQIQDKFLVRDLPLATAHWQDMTAILQFSNDSLREVN